MPWEGKITGVFLHALSESNGIGLIFSLVISAHSWGPATQAYIVWPGFSLQSLFQAREWAMVGVGGFPFSPLPRPSSFSPYSSPSPALPAASTALPLCVGLQIWFHCYHLLIHCRPGWIWRRFFWNSSSCKKKCHWCWPVLNWFSIGCVPRSWCRCCGNVK